MKLLDSYPNDSEIFLMVKVNAMTALLLIGSVVWTPLSKSWYTMWLLMEVNMVSMALQLMAEQSKEKLIMFFIFQSMPSMVLLIYILTSDTMEIMMSPMSKVLVLLAVTISVGMFPMQKWILKMSKMMSWVNNLIMMTWQKIIPLLLLMKMKWFPIVTITMAALSMLAMCGIMVASTSVKPFLMSSSIIHVSWMLTAMSPMKAAPIIYLCIYSMISILLVKKMSMTNKKMINEQMKKIVTPTKVLMLSMSGMPPMAGFIMKMGAICMMVMSTVSKKVLVMVLMVATTTFYCYLQILWKSMILMKMSEKTSSAPQTEMPSSTTWLNTGWAPMALML